MELGLAAQADSFPAARDKLSAMIDHYIDDATEGEDKRYARQLLSRRATVSVYLLYYCAFIAQVARKLRVANDHATKIFSIPEPHAQRC